MNLSGVRDFLLSPWSFYFRWPVIRVQKFRPQAILWGPFFQTAVFAFFCKALGFLNLGTQPFQFLTAAFLLSAFTGFFHEDGFADTADSLCVSKFNSSDEVLAKIQHAFKDPRLGTFGVSALLALWFYRYSATFLFRLSFYDLCFCYLVSRTTALTFGVVCARVSKAAKNARSSHLMNEMGLAATTSVFGLVLGSAIALRAWGAWSENSLGGSHSVPELALAGAGVAAGAVMGGALLGSALVKRSESLNGDLLGAIACGTEIVAGLLCSKFF